MSYNERKSKQKTSDVLATHTERAIYDQISRVTDQAWHSGWDGHLSPSAGTGDRQIPRAVWSKTKGHNRRLY